MHVHVSLKVERAATARLTQMEEQIHEAGRPAMREALKQAIRHGVDQAMQGLRDLGKGLPAEPSETIQTAVSYPVGSGMIERAVALVINRRMKKRGMRWCRSNATAIVALRVDLLNDDWVTPQQLRAFP
jgi:hypothetical protein